MLIMSRSESGRHSWPTPSDTPRSAAATRCPPNAATRYSSGRAATVLDRCADRYPFDGLATHEFRLQQADEALHMSVDPADEGRRRAGPHPVTD
jgi:hypothetical protein